MAKATIPELKKFMDKRLMLQLNCNRKVSGVLRGYDPFMNLVIEDAFEEPNHEPLGSLVFVHLILGNSWEYCNYGRGFVEQNPQ